MFIKGALAGDFWFLYFAGIKSKWCHDFVFNPNQNGFLALPTKRG
jgi:hypothetical protein